MCGAHILWGGGGRAQGVAVERQSGVVGGHAGRVRGAVQCGCRHPGAGGVRSGCRIISRSGHVVPRHGWEALALQNVKMVLEVCVGKGVRMQAWRGFEQWYWGEWQGCFMLVCSRGGGLVHQQYSHAGSSDVFEEAPADPQGGLLGLGRAAGLVECCMSEGGCVCHLPSEVHGQACLLCQPGSMLAGLASAMASPTCWPSLEVCQLLH